MPTPTVAGVPPRTWRAAVVLFLAVLLGGTGLSGAHALWSARGAVTATVATGTWAPAREPGWAWQPPVAAVIPEAPAHRELIIDWAPPADAGTSVSYATSLTPQGTGRIVEGPLPVEGDSSAVRYRVHHNFLPDTFVLTLTATVDGVPSAPVTLLVRIEETGAPVITSATP
ncbi:hypothetical protein E7744_01230 [Citricoccus sp. SGAir0253]|uniref:hypothetical protein n=1 Tax=Citricoccus sp. SGAir0253 TaxID=2567881 RepID=UPI0010CD6839|nr:hypothetical protein [Citricoccus sp. SGAir0253]QCU76998.1 hypothetical protein E7744_01230 [Citricoccus sp. SGAir0253]